MVENIWWRHRDISQTQYLSIIALIYIFVWSATSANDEERFVRSGKTIYLNNSATICLYESNLYGYPYSYRHRRNQPWGMRSRKFFNWNWSENLTKFEYNFYGLYFLVTNLQLQNLCKCHYVEQVRLAKKGS